MLGDTILEYSKEWKIRTQHRPNKQSWFLVKEMSTNEKR